MKKIKRLASNLFGDKRTALTMNFSTDIEYPTGTSGRLSPYYFEHDHLIAYEFKKIIVDIEETVQRCQKSNLNFSFQISLSGKIHGKHIENSSNGERVFKLPIDSDISNYKFVLQLCIQYLSNFGIKIPDDFLKEHNLSLNEMNYVERYK